MDLPPPTDLEALPYVAARDQWPRGTNALHDWIVLHGIQSGETGSAAENCAAYFADPGPNRKASTQFVCDNNSTIRCMEWNTQGASAVGANVRGWHIEQAGFASQSDTDWHDEYSTAMIQTQVAPLIAALCIRDGIPARFLDAAALKRGERGLTDHHQCWLAFGGDVRTDPGPFYPWAEVIEYVEAILNPEPTPPDPDPGEDDMHFLGCDANGDYWEFDGLFRSHVENNEFKAILMSPPPIGLALPDVGEVSQQLIDTRIDTARITR